MTEPRQKRGRSKQDYSTPWEFIRAVEARFSLSAGHYNGFDLDLAAGPENAKADEWIDARGDALSLDWRLLNFQNAWLNPPFADIEPWVKRAAKCAFSTQRPLQRIFMLTPASIGTDWFAMNVHQKALVLGLSSRITFEGMSYPYPKDLMLSVFGEFPGFGVWRWRQ